MKEPDPPSPSASERPTVRVMAERMVAGRLSPRMEPDATAEQVEQLLADLFRVLSHWVGSTGCEVLFTRAFVGAAVHHPQLRGIRYTWGSATPRLDALREHAHRNGSESTVEAVTAVLDSMITILSGLVGEDLAMSLLEDRPLWPDATVPRTPEMGS